MAANDHQEQETTNSFTASASPSFCNNVGSKTPRNCGYHPFFTIQQHKNENLIKAVTM